MLCIINIFGFQENYGLDKIELRDNGVGISVLDILFVVKKYYIFKIISFFDFEDLEIYGFRGEVLGLFCNVFSLLIITSIKEEEVSFIYNFNY